MMRTTRKELKSMLTINMIFESIGADVGETVQDNSAASTGDIFTKFHTPRQELSTSSKLDGDQNGERNATRTLFSGSKFFWWSCTRNTQVCKRPRSGTSYASKTVSLDRNFPTGRQPSSFDQDTSGHLVAVLSKVNASDFSEA